MVLFLSIIIALLLSFVTGLLFYMSGKDEGYKKAYLEITGGIKEGHIVVKNKIYSVSELKK